MAVKRYDGSAWQTVAGLGAQGPAATSSSIATWVKTASGGETSLSGNDDSSQALSYTVGQELVFINGTLLKRGSDYTATNGTSITGLTALAANDVATVWTVNAFSVTGAIANSIVDAKGDLIVATGADTPGRLAVGTNGQYLKADSTTGTGLAWATLSSGKVLQVVQGTYSTATTIASQTYTDTGLSVSITPSSSSSKILLLVNQMIYWYREADEAGSAIRLMRDSTAILDNFGARGNFFHRFLTSVTEELVEHATEANLMYLDSPATTSAITYKTQGRAKNTANVGTLICQESSTTSVIIALEIGA